MLTPSILAVFNFAQFYHFRIVVRPICFRCVGPHGFWERNEKRLFIWMMYGQWASGNRNMTSKTEKAVVVKGKTLWHIIKSSFWWDSGLFKKSRNTAAFSALKIQCGMSCAHCLAWLNSARRKEKEEREREERRKKKSVRKGKEERAKKKEMKWEERKRKGNQL